MRSRASTHVTRGQWSLAFFSLVCLALHPGFVLKWNEGGFSNYGIHIKTAIAYSLGFFLAAYFSWRGARELEGHGARTRTLRNLLYFYGVLMVLCPVSTYGYSRTAALRDFHTIVGIITMLFEPVAAVWLFARLRGVGWDALLLTVEFVGLALAVIDYVKLLHVLFLAQVLTAGAFGFLLVHAVSRQDQLRDTSSSAAPW